MKINQSNIAECLARIAKAGKVGAAEAQRILDQMEREGMRLTAENVANPYVEAAQRLADKATDAAKGKRLDALRNLKTRVDTLGEVETRGGVKTAAATIKDIQRGIQSQWLGRGALWISAVDAHLKQLGLQKVAMSAQLDRQTAVEMWAIRGAGESEVGADHPAHLIADTLVRVMNDALRRLNAAGARIADATDYVTKTVHDAYKLRAAAGSYQNTPEEAFQAWWGFTKPKLAEKTFDDLDVAPAETEDQARDRFGRAVWEALVTGVHKTMRGSTGLEDELSPAPPGFAGTFNLARSLSQQRTLYWNSGGDWYDYMAKFANMPNLTKSIMASLDQSARSLALMDRLGTNPTGNLSLIKRKIMERYRPDVDGVNRFKKDWDGGFLHPGVDAIQSWLDGSANIPKNQLWSDIYNMVRNFEVTASLGAVQIAHAASVFVTVPLEAKVHMGPGALLPALGNMMHFMGRSLKGEEQQAFLRDVGALSQGFLRDLHGQFYVHNDVPGKVSAIAAGFMKWTGIHELFDRAQASTRFMLASNLAHQMERPFDQLEPHVAIQLQRYRIGAEEWELIRHVGDLQKLGDNTYLTPRDFEKIDPAQAEDYLRRNGGLPAQGEADVPKPEQVAPAVRGLIDRLQDSYGGYLADAAAHSTVTPGVFEKALMYGADQPGTMARELRQFLWQFKGWPVAAMTQTLYKQFRYSLDKKELAWGLGYLIGASTIGGYMRGAILNVAAGRPPEDLGKPMTYLKALAHGGGLGLMGDYLFGDINRMTGIASFGGPVVGDAAQLIQIFQKFKDDIDATNPHRRGRFSDIWPDLARFASHKIPVANLIYLRGAMDYLVWFHLYEAASPGWWSRSNRRLQRNGENTMQGFSPGAGVPWGIPPFYVKPPGAPSQGLFGDRRPWESQ